MTSDSSINKNTCMKKNVIITIIIVLVLSVIYSNTSKHVSQFLWKYNDSDFSESYEDMGATDKPCGGGLSTLTKKPLPNDT